MGTAYSLSNNASSQHYSDEIYAPSGLLVRGLGLVWFWKKYIGNGSMGGNRELWGEAAKKDLSSHHLRLA